MRGGIALDSTERANSEILLDEADMAEWKKTGFVNMPTDGFGTNEDATTAIGKALNHTFEMNALRVDYDKQRMKKLNKQIPLRQLTATLLGRKAEA